MHGNTRYTADGIKTRHFDDILSELEQAFAIHRACGSRLGGVHFELTGEDVTECLGGARGLSEADLQRLSQRARSASELRAVAGDGHAHRRPHAPPLRDKRPQQ